MTPSGPDLELAKRFVDYLNDLMTYDVPALGALAPSTTRRK